MFHVVDLIRQRANIKTLCTDRDEVDSEAGSSEEDSVVVIVVALAVVDSADEEDSKADHQAVDTEGESRQIFLLRAMAWIEADTACACFMSF